VDGLLLAIALEFDAVSGGDSLICGGSIERIYFYNIFLTVLGKYKIRSFGSDPFTQPLVGDIAFRGSRGRTNGRDRWRLLGLVTILATYKEICHQQRSHVKGTSCHVV
jgi:hypothetical protein